MTVSELLARVTSRELTEWMAYFDLLAERQAKPPKGRDSAKMTQNPEEMKDAFRALAARAKPRKGRR